MPLDNISKKSVEELDSEIEVENARKIEAALFIAGRFMSLQELIAITDVNPILLKKILADLQDKYKDFGLSIVQRGNSWKMDVAEELVWMVNRLATGSSEFSKAEQETLAIIAYKHPIKQSVIVRIRGNKAYDHIKRFVEAGLVNKKKTGHTSELTLTEQFHNYFNVDKGSSIDVGSEGSSGGDGVELINDKTVVGGRGAAGDVGVDGSGSVGGGSSDVEKRGWEDEGDITEKGEVEGGG